MHHAKLVKDGEIKLPFDYVSSSVRGGRATVASHGPQLANGQIAVLKKYGTQHLANCRKNSAATRKKEAKERAAKMVAELELPENVENFLHHRVDNGMSAGGKGDGKKSSATCFAYGGNHTLRNCKNKKKLREFKSKFPDRYQKYRGRFEDKADAKRSKDEEEDFGVSFASHGMTMPGLISGSDSSEDDDDYTDMPGLLSGSDSESDSDDDESRCSSYESTDSEDDATGDDDIPGLASDSESESGDEQTLQSKCEANADGLSCPAIGKSKKSILKNAASFMAASETPILDSGATHSQWPVLDEMHNVTNDVPSLRLMTSNGTVMLTKAGNVGKVQKVYYNPHSPPILLIRQMLDNNNVI